MNENQTITDIRSCFELVNQLAPFHATSPMMAPFRDLLKSTRTFGKKVCWDHKLMHIFEQTNLEICKLAEQGLAFYNSTKETSIITDWSKLGHGFVVLQKHWEYIGEIDPQNGWKLAFCNSRHLLLGESNYAPIEGEAYGVVWAFKRQGCFYLEAQNSSYLLTTNLF